LQLTPWVFALPRGCHRLRTSADRLLLLLLLLILVLL